MIARRRPEGQLLPLWMTDIDSKVSRKEQLGELQAQKEVEIIYTTAHDAIIGLAARRLHELEQGGNDE